MAEVKNIKEVLAAVEALGVAAKQVMKDGKVDLTDLAVVLGLFQKADVFVKAVEGVQEIPAEVKDIDGAEAQELLAALMKAFTAIKAA